MQVIAANILGPLPEIPLGNKYILVVADYFTRWTKAYGILNQQAITVATKLVEELFLCFSPVQLESDQGTQFDAKIMTNVRRILDMHETSTIASHPQGDSLIEIFNYTLLTMLAMCAQQHPPLWKLHS